MDTRDLLLLATSRLLRMPDDVFPKAKIAFASFFQGFDFEHPQKPNSYSICGTTAEGERVGYWHWLEELRNRGFRNAKVTDEEPKGDLTPHIAAAFANGTQRILQLESSTTRETYGASELFARQTALTGPEVAELLDFQFQDSATQDELWREVLSKDISRYGAFMGATKLEDARRFFHEGYEASLCPANEILRTAQHFCARRSVQFRIPPALQSKLEKQVPLPAFGDPYAPYVTQPLTIKELFDWINAQRDTATFWQKMADQMHWLVEGQSEFTGRFREGMSGLETEAEFRKLSDHHLQLFPMGNLTNAFEENFVIPEHLKSKFTYPERPPIPDEDVWIATRNPEPWRMLIFEYLNEATLDRPSSKGAPDSTLQNEFARVLAQAEVFADRTENPFADAFRLAIWLLESPSVRLQNQESLLASAQEALLPANALDFIQQRLFVDIYRSLQFSDLELRLLLATQAADVFGGMGSWNDQVFDDGTENSDYHRVSQDLFRALTKLRRALI